jgi:hypothetical protein
MPLLTKIRVTNTNNPTTASTVPAEKRNQVKFFIKTGKSVTVKIGFFSKVDKQSLRGKQFIECNTPSFLPNQIAENGVLVSSR